MYERFEQDRDDIQQWADTLKDGKSAEMIGASRFKLEAQHYGDLVKNGEMSFYVALNDLAQYVKRKTGGADASSRFYKAAELYMHDPAFWNYVVRKGGSDTTDGLLGQYIGGAVFGIADFMHSLTAQHYGYNDNRDMRKFNLYNDRETNNLDTYDGETQDLDTHNRSINDNRSINGDTHNRIAAMDDEEIRYNAAAVINDAMQEDPDYVQDVLDFVKGIPEGVMDFFIENKEELTDMALDLSPGIGDAKGFVEAINGKSTISQQPLAWWERVINAASAAPVVGSGLDGIKFLERFSALAIIHITNKLPINIKSVIPQAADKITRITSKVVGPIEDAIKNKKKLNPNTFRKIGHHSEKLFELSQDEMAHIIKASELKGLDNQTFGKTAKNKLMEKLGYFEKDKKPYTVTIDGDGVIHAFDSHGSKNYKEHLNNTKDPNRQKQESELIDEQKNKGQIPITQDDFQKIPEIISQPNDIRYSKEGVQLKGHKDNFETLQFNKSFGKGKDTEYFYLLFRIDYDRKQFIFTSLFKKPSKKR
ncbi:hypothetical protein MCHI_003884 [Candidatus Magnetoovum chiemensis]|nr:hypothetical protein MCHI_003884 [Candidatus Magnetoovum chiemensis]